MQGSPTRVLLTELIRRQPRKAFPAFLSASSSPGGRGKSFGKSCPPGGGAWGSDGVDISPGCRPIGVVGRRFGQPPDGVARDAVQRYEIGTVTCLQRRGGLSRRAPGAAGRLAPARRRLPPPPASASASASAHAPTAAQGWARCGKTRFTAHGVSKRHWRCTRPGSRSTLTAKRRDFQAVDRGVALQRQPHHAAGRQHQFVGADDGGQAVARVDTRRPHHRRPVTPTIIASFGVGGALARSLPSVAQAGGSAANGGSMPPPTSRRAATKPTAWR